jgi:hypothetical protein
MNTSPVKVKQAQAKEVRMDEHMLHVFLVDGRKVSVPLAWFPRLRKAGRAERNHWRLVGNGLGIHWPDLDEDILVAALLE